MLEFISSLFSIFGTIFSLEIISGITFQDVLFSFGLVAIALWFLGIVNRNSSGGES